MPLLAAAGDYDRAASSGESYSSVLLGSVGGGGAAPASEAMRRDSDMFDALGGVVFPFSDAELREVDCCDECARLVLASCFTSCHLASSFNRAGFSKQYSCYIGALKLLGDATKTASFVTCLPLYVATSGGAATTVVLSGNAFPAAPCVLAGLGLSAVSAATAVGIGYALDALNISVTGSERHHVAKFAVITCVLPVCLSFALSKAVASGAVRAGSETEGTDYVRV